MAKPKEPKPPKPPTKKLRKEFFKACSGDNVEAIAKYLDDGLDPSTMFQLDYDEPALAWVLDRNRLPKIARLLLDRGIDVKLASSKGVTALHRVTDPAIAAELIERGADVNARDHYNRTPLYTAAANKQQAVVEVLAARGADLEAADNEGVTAYGASHHPGVRAALRAAGAKSFGPGGGTIYMPTEILEDQPRSAIATDRGAVGCDREGNIWFWGYGNGGMLLRYDGTKLTGYRFSQTFAVGEIAPGPPGVVYFATNWGLMRLEGGEFRMFSTQDSELFDHHITSMTTDEHGHVYLTSYESEAEDKHITVFDGAEFRLLYPGKDFPLGIELEHIRFDSAGELILCGRGGYAIKRDGAWVKTDKIDPNNPFSTVVYDVAVDGDTLWIGTQSGVFEQRGDAVTKHDTKNLAKYLLKNGDTLWVGTYYGGLVRIRGGELTIFDAKNSVLPNDDVAGLVRGADGTLWVHTANGIATVKHDELSRFE